VQVLEQKVNPAQVSVEETASKIEPE
jgi:hypothetical protein